MSVAHIQSIGVVILPHKSAVPRIPSPCHVSSLQHLALTRAGAAPGVKVGRASIGETPCLLAAGSSHPRTRCNFHAAGVETTSERGGGEQPKVLLSRMGNPGKYPPPKSLCRGRSSGGRACAPPQTARFFFPVDLQLYLHAHAVGKMCGIKFKVEICVP